MERVEGVVGRIAVAVPQLAATGVGYAAWCPAMENALMRAGVTARDYKENLADGCDWTTLVAAVERWATDDEATSIAYALGRGKPASSSSSSTESTAAQKEARRGATDSVGRTKKAYTMLYDALPGELRRLVAHVAQGDARTLWTWLKTRFQSTEQDNIGDLWDKFTSLSQTSEETFDEYKARVDEVYALLGHASDKPSAGLYAHRLLWKLSARYTPAVLALKASGKLKDATKIDWNDVTSFINNHERSEHRLLGNDDADERAMAATTRQARRNGNATTETRHCFNCNERGHLSRDCNKPPRRRGGHNDDNDVGDNRDGDDSGGVGSNNSGDNGSNGGNDTYGRTRQSGVNNGDTRYSGRSNTSGYTRNDGRHTGRVMMATTRTTSDNHGWTGDRLDDGAATIWY